MTTLEPQDWYRTFFRDVAIELWQRAVPPEQTALEIPFLERTLVPRGGRAELLDVPCGAGRHAIALAARGHRMTGVDLSTESLDRARRTATEAGVEVEWIEADMRELPAARRFDGAYCFGNSFGYLGPAAMRAFVQGIGRALRPGGRFVIDSGMVAESILPNLEERAWYRFGDMLFLIEHDYQPLESCLKTQYSFIRGAEVETRTGLHWVFTLREVASMLDDAGMSVLEALDGVGGEPYTVGSGGLVLVAERRSA